MTGGNLLFLVPGLGRSFVKNGMVLIMRVSNKFLFIYLFIIAVRCVPVKQQIAESQAEKEASEIEGFVGPTVVDLELFDHVTSSKVYDRMNIDDQLLPVNSDATYEGTFDGNMVYIKNCKCLRNPRILRDKLVVVHLYGGGASNRLSTVLLWSGRHYRNSNGEYIVDVILFSDKIDFHKAGLTDRKVFDVSALQHTGVNSIWINLIGYNGLVKYDYN